MDGKYGPFRRLIMMGLRGKMAFCVTWYVSKIGVSLGLLRNKSAIGIICGRIQQKERRIALSTSVAQHEWTDTNTGYSTTRGYYLGRSMVDLINKEADKVRVLIR